MNEVINEIGEGRDCSRQEAGYRNLGFGPSTAYLMARAFSGSVLIGHESAADLLGMCTKTLTAEGDAGRIAYRIKGSRNRTYSEDDIICFIKGTEYAKEQRKCPSTSQKTRNTGNTTSVGKAKGFTALRGKQANAARNKSKAA